MDADGVFDSLASSVRRDILAYLSMREEASAGEIAEAIDEVGRTAVSTHLRILRSTGLVRERKDGRMRLYSLDREGPAMIAVGYFQSLMNATLDDIGVVVEADVPRVPAERDARRAG